MPTIPIPLIGGDVEQSALKLNAQQTFNWFPDVAGPEAVNPRSLTQRPGLKLLGNTAQGRWRAYEELRNKLYGVSGNTFYEIQFDSDLTPTFVAKGTISTVSANISIASNRNQIMIVGGNTTDGYIFDSIADTFEKITDPDFTGATSVTSVDNFFFFTFIDSDQIGATALGDGSSINALDFTTADVKGDENITSEEYLGELWVFGTDSVQVYYNAALPAQFPFAARKQATLDYGCAASNSVAKAGNAILWLDSRRYVTISRGYKAEVISPPWVNKQISEYSVVSDATAFSYSQRGHIFYQLSFPTEGVTWVYNVVTNMWHRVTTSVSGNEEDFLCHYHAFFNGNHFMGSRIDGKFFQFDENTTEDDGQPIFRKRVSQHLSNSQKIVRVPHIELYLDTRNYPGTTGQGSDPEVLFRYSKDGGNTWSNTLTRKIGSSGQYDRRIRFNRLGKARNWTFEFRITDPVTVDIIAAYAQVNIEEE